MIRISLLTLIGAGVFCHTVRGQQPAIVLTGNVSGSENHTYREILFEVPKGTGRITIDFSYSGRDQHTAIDLGLFDPERFRGWGGGKHDIVTLSETDATPSYLPGPIRAGTWKLLLGVPNIRSGVRSEFTAKVYFLRAGDAPTVSTFSSEPLRMEPGWYRGDLHLHTAHSDGSCVSQSGQSAPCPVFRIVSAAADRHLDFVAITDHNATSQYQALRELQPYFDRLLIIPGREITTFEGHANVFGTTEFIDFRVGSSSVPTMNDLFSQVERLHALISINHPNGPAGEECMGCRWEAADADLARVQAVEAVNDGNAEGPLAGIPFWETQLNRGFHLTGIGGSDTHRPDDKSRPLSGVGYPTTVVQAAELSERAILAGIRAGHVFIDTEGTANRLLEMTATSGGETATMGGSLNVSMAAAIHFFVHTTHSNGARIEVIEDSHPISHMSDPRISGDDARQSFDVAGDGRHHWIRINVRSPENHLLLVGNPIYW
ncbi:MAG TPA: CehA/McbA family metallohydrolase [Bryobacteraceae bacterium]